MTSPLSSPPKPVQVPILRVPFDAADRKFIADGLTSILDTGGLTMGRFTKDFEADRTNSLAFSDADFDYRPTFSAGNLVMYLCQSER